MVAAADRGGRGRRRLCRGSGQVVLYGRQLRQVDQPKGGHSKPFKPKVVKYEIFGSATHANVNYLDLSAEPRRLDSAPLPWTLVLSTTAPSVFPNISAQSDGDFLGCRITVDDEIKDEQTSNGVHALTSCLVKSA